MGENVNRYSFLDILRGWAILIMIEVHIFNETLSPFLLNSNWFQIIHFINGMVAPTFIFVSGFVFILSGLKKKEAYSQFKIEFWKQIFRIFMVWMIGYILHFPFMSFSKMINAEPEEWYLFYQSNVLHCIAFGWLILFIARMFFKSDKKYLIFMIFGSFFFIFGSFYTWSRNFNGVIPGFISSYLNGNISLFPIFPWLGFLFAGGIMGLLFQKAKEKNLEKEFVKKILIIAFIFFIFFIPMSFIQLPMDWKINPFFFFIRLAVIFIFIYFSWRYTNKRPLKSFILSTASKESLFIYVGHLILLYTKLFAGGKSLAMIFHGQFNLIQSIVSTLGLITVMIIAAKLWQLLKQRKTLFRSLAGIYIIILLILFFNC